MGVVLEYPGSCGSREVSPPNPRAEEELYRRDRHRHRLIEIATTGVDEQLQGIGGDPYGGLSRLGLRVPFLATPDQDSRYLFMLASFTVGEGARVRIRNARQLWTLGAKFTTVATGATRIVEQEVVSPSFQPQGANISWHLRIIDRGQTPVPRGIGVAANGNVRNIAFRDSDTSALLYESLTTPTAFYVNLSAYTPPNRGRPWGQPLDTNQGTYYDLRVPWQVQSDWLDIPVNGPAKVALYASVKQAIIPASPVAVPSPEETFISDVATAPNGVTTTGAMIWRVAGGLLLQLDR